MKITKYAHACIALDKGESHLVIDPGTFTPNAEEIIADTNSVLITHEHTDHFNIELISTALSSRPEFKVFAPVSVTAKLNAREGQVVTVADGANFRVGDIQISVHGKDHAHIHSDIPIFVNVGYLIDDRIFHPGDSYVVPPLPLEVLLLPTSGPWVHVNESIDYVRAVNPKILIQIHEVMLSEAGQQTLVRILGPSMLNVMPLTILTAGESITI